MTSRNMSQGVEYGEQALWLLKRAFHQGHRMAHEALRSDGVTPTQMGVLNRLLAEPGLSGAELARRLLVTPQAAQVAFSTLEQRGLVKRSPDAHHGRIVRTSLTAEGRRVAKRCLATGLVAQDKFLAPLSESERGTLLELLARLASPDASL